MPLAIKLAFNHRFLADHRHNRDVATRPFLMVEHTIGANGETLYVIVEDVPRLCRWVFLDLFPNLFRYLAFSSEALLPSLRNNHQDKLVLFLALAPVFRHPHMIVRYPAGRIERRCCRIVGVLRICRLEQIARHVIEHEGKAHVRFVGFLRVRIDIDRHRIGNAPDVNLLIEAFIIDVIGNDAPSTIAATHLPFRCGIVSLLRMRLVFNVANHILEDLRALI